MDGTRPQLKKRSTGRTKFLIGGLLIAAAIIYLITSATSASAQYYMTVDELVSQGQATGDRAVRVSGAVDGTTIDYDAQSLTLRFTVADVTGDMNEIDARGGLAKVLHEAVHDPSATRLQVVYEGPKPDLLRDEAQAIMTGHMGSDGIFHADELLLKCPSRYSDEVPAQSG
jgi:cytochrome c-type biogenesis protein CcmE